MGRVPFTHYDKLRRSSCDCITASSKDRGKLKRLSQIKPCQPLLWLVFIWKQFNELRHTFIYVAFLEYIIFSVALHVAVIMYNYSLLDKGRHSILFCSLQNYEFNVDRMIFFNNHHHHHHPCQSLLLQPSSLFNFVGK